MTHILIGVVLAAFVLNCVLSIIMVFFERRNPTSTWAWMIVLMLMPFLGFIIYMVFGQDVRKHRTFSVKAKKDNEIKNAFFSSYEGGLYRKLMGSQMKAIKDHENILEESVRDTFLDMVYHNLNCDESALLEENDVKIYHEGQKKFEDLIKDIRSAKTHIYIEYYVIRNDELGKRIIFELAEKAKEGIKVQLLYDGMGCLKLPKKFFDPLVNNGGVVASFLPPLIPLINIRVNYRNHRKICVIDGNIGYIGGFNIGNEYLGKVKKFGYWRDLHLRIEGNAVSLLQLRFIMDWNFADNRRLEIEESYFESFYKSKQNVKMQLVSSGPDTNDANIKNAFFKMMNEAEFSIYFTTPYFVPDDSILTALKVAAYSGLDVRIIFPANPDHPFVYWASISYMGELLDAGVKCYQYKKGFIHSKMVVVDKMVSSVGTANMDIRSFKLNFEINAFIYDKEVAMELERQFIKDLQDCEEITRSWYDKRNFIFRIKEAFSRLISPIL